MTLCLGLKNRLEVVLLRNIDGVFHECADISLTGERILLSAGPAALRREPKTSIPLVPDRFRHVNGLPRNALQCDCSLAGKRLSRTVVFRYNDCAITLQRPVHQNTCVGQIMENEINNNPEAYRAAFDEASEELKQI